MKFLISDTHFGHSRIIRYCNRPFKNVDEMDRYLINEWNKVISPDDEVWHLGDLAFGNREYIANIVSQLNGKKILILGNHDKRGRTFFYDIGFEEVHKRPVTIGQLVFSHEPLTDLSYDMFNFHGHIHNIDPNTVAGYDPQININVSADVIGFKPVHINDLLEDETQWNMETNE